MPKRKSARRNQKKARRARTRTTTMPSARAANSLPPGAAPPTNPPAPTPPEPAPTPPVQPLEQLERTPLETAPPEPPTPEQLASAKSAATIPARRAGRPRLLDARARREVLNALGAGCTLEVAASFVACSEKTLRREMNRDPKFAAAVAHARGQGAADPLLVMKQAARANWRAAAWMLERAMPEKYAQQKKPQFGRADARRLAADLVRILATESKSIPPEVLSRLGLRLTAAVDYATRAALDIERTGRHLERAVASCETKTAQPAAPRAAAPRTTALRATAPRTVAPQAAPPALESIAPPAPPIGPRDQTQNAPSCAREKNPARPVAELDKTSAWHDAELDKTPTTLEVEIAKFLEELLHARAAQDEDFVPEYEFGQNSAAGQNHPPLEGRREHDAQEPLLVA